MSEILLPVWAHANYSDLWFSPAIERREGIFPGEACPKQRIPRNPFDKANHPQYNDSCPLWRGAPCLELKNLPGYLSGHGACDLSYFYFDPRAVERFAVFRFSFSFFFFLFSFFVFSMKKPYPLLVNTAKRLSDTKRMVCNASSGSTSSLPPPSRQWLPVANGGCSVSQHLGSTRDSHPIPRFCKHTILFYFSGFHPFG